MQYERIAKIQAGFAPGLMDCRLFHTQRHLSLRVQGAGVFPWWSGLMSGDVGIALEPGDVPIFVEDFDHHLQYMKGFHQRWMPSNRAKRDWIERVRELQIDILAPQHGRLFRGDDVRRFLDWFEALEVGVAVRN